LCPPRLSVAPCFCRARMFSSFFTAPATTEIYTLSLHDALPISAAGAGGVDQAARYGRHLVEPDVEDRGCGAAPDPLLRARHDQRSEEHTSELQSRENLVCRLLLEKKKKNNNKT